MSVPDPLDFLTLETLLDDEHRLIRDSVRRFVDHEVLPGIGACFAAHRFPVELVPSLAGLGLLGMTLEGYGCAGLGKRAYGLVCRELERGDSSLRSFVSVQSSLVMGSIAAFGNDAQRDRWLPALASGAAIGCFGLTESHGGSDPGNMRTRAVRQGGEWTLSGEKQWITNAGIADLAVVWARTEEGIAAFVVEHGAPGFTRREIANKLSLRASSTGELHFDGVRVPEVQRLAGATGLGAALSRLDEARFGIVWGALGAAEACIAEAVEFVRDRTLFGAPLGGKQLVQARLADHVRRFTTAELLAQRLTDLAEAGRLSTPQISLGKWNNVRMALDVARDCRDLLGAAGITAEHHAIRHMLNLESVVTYEGTESVHELVVGRAITGTAAF